MTASAASDITRGQWWNLASGKTVEVCRVQYSTANRAFIATVRHLDENNVMAHGSFDVLASFITRTAKKVR